MARNFQNATPKGGKNTGSDIWLTPKWLIDATGPYDLDPCAHLVDGKPIVPTARDYITEEQNGLTSPWYGDVFVNPPYSNLNEWLQKCKYEHSGNDAVNSIMVLCFARTETKAFQNNLYWCDGINLIKGRIKFLNQFGVEQGNGNAPSVLIAFGARAYEKLREVEGIVFRNDRLRLT